MSVSCGTGTAAVESKGAACRLEAVSLYGLHTFVHLWALAHVVPCWSHPTHATKGYRQWCGCPQPLAPLVSPGKGLDPRCCATCASASGDFPPWQSMKTLTRFSTSLQNNTCGRSDSDGKLLVLPAAIGSAIPAAVAGISFTMVYIEPPRGFTLGIHALVSTMLQRGVLVVVAGEPGDCRGIVDSLREQHQDTGFCAIKLSVYHLNKKSPQFTMGCTEVNLLSKHPLPQKVSRPHCDPGCSDTRSKITTKWSFRLVAAGASSFH